MDLDIFCARILPAEEPSLENGVVSSSSSTSSSPFAAPPQQVQHINRNNQFENGATIDILETEMLCDESFCEILKKEEEIFTISDASSTDCTIFSLDVCKKRRIPSTDDDDEEDGNGAEAVSVGTKIRRIDEEEERKGNKNGETEHGQNETGEDDGNQEFEPDKGEEDINQENNTGEEDHQEKDESKEAQEEAEEEEVEKTVEEAEEEEKGKAEQEELEDNKFGERDEDQNGEGKRKSTQSELYDSKVPLCSTAETEEKHSENTGGEDIGNHQNSEHNEGKEDGENDEKEEETEVKETEAEKQKAYEKGKRPMGEKCKLKSMVPKFSVFEKGGPSDTPEGDQTQEPIDQYENDDHQILAILKSIWHFNCNKGYFPYPQSNELHNYIMDSVPNLKILGEDLTNKIVTLEDNFKSVKELDGDNPDVARTIDREIFDLSMRLWGNSEDNIRLHDVEQQNLQPLSDLLSEFDIFL